MMEVCAICMESVFLPVQLTCFDCYKDNTVNCSSFARLCRKCAHNYLQLDLDLYDRDLLKRCLLCPGFAHPRFLNHSNAYRKDFLLMNQDTRTAKCPYCLDVEGTQIVLDRHIDSECAHVPIQGMCGHIVLRGSVANHVTNCSEYVRCEFCHEHVFGSDMRNHLMYEHHLIECTQCKSPVPQLMISIHKTDHCPKRMHACEMCSDVFPHDGMRDHYNHHLRCIEVQMKATRQKLLRLISYVRKIHAILNTDSRHPLPE